MPDHSSKKTNKKKIITLKRLKNWTLSLLGVLIILLAISFTLVRVAIKSIPEYSLAIQKIVSEQMGMKLEIGILDAEISWLVPRLNLMDVNIFDKTGKHHLMHLDEVDLSMDWAKSMKNMAPIVGEITLDGLNVQIGINKESQLLIQNFIIDNNIDDTINSANKNNIKTGIEISETIKNNFNSLDFKVINSQVMLYDDRHKQRSKTLSNVNLHLINNGNTHVFEVEANFPKNYAEYAHFIIDIKGDLFDYKNLQGELYLAVQDVNVASWLDDYWDEINISANANLNGQFWLKWNAQEIVDVNSKINISSLAMHYLGESVETWNIDKIDAQVRWEKTNEDGWQLDVRELVVARENIDWPRPAAATLEVNNSRQEIKLRADYLRVEGLVYLAGMINSVVETDVSWMNLLSKHKPSGELKNLDVDIKLDELQNIKINTQFSQLGFSLPDSEPSEINNLQGSVAYIDKTTWMILDSTNTQIKFNKLFRDPIDLKVLNGTIELTHKNKLWELSTHSLTINTPYIETQMRVDFNMPDGGSPFLDLTLLFKNGEGTAVKKYLPVAVMTKDAVEWIDRSINKGQITKGGYQFYGYVSDAPFRENEGVSLADFDAVNVDLTYLDNWPDVKDISANLRFVNDTMYVKAHHGHMFNSKITDTTVYIDNFISPTLDIKGKVDVDLQDLKTFVSESTLHEDVTDYIQNLSFSGKGDLDLELFVPLYGEYRTEVGGRLNVKNGKLKFEKEKYELNNINGLIQFVGDTVESTGLQMQLAGNLPEQLLSVEINTKKNETNRTYHLNLNGDILVSSLLTPLPKAQTFLNGVSNWDMQIDIINDESKSETIVNAVVVSDLQGVTSRLPGPLSKATKSASPIKIDIKVKPKSYINYELNFGSGDKLKLKQLPDKLLVSVDALSVRGDINVNTLEGIDIPIKIDLEYLNINKFFKHDEIKGSETGESPKMLSPREIPSIDFYAKKLIWKKSIYNESTLKLQESKLGVVIDSFKLSAGDHIISGKGSWFTGRNDQSTTKLDINVDVYDLGSVFKSLEISEGLVGTSGKINLRWQWNDAPFNFNWKAITGDGSLSLKDGKLNELNAGAGRLLGVFNFETLFSLDFGSQVKEGFSFDKVNGSFTFLNANIRSDDFTIESKVADIVMKGRMSIANNDIDQVVTVRPHVGATVTIGTAVVAGPAIGGIVFLLQKIFNTDRLAEYQYTMKGTMDDPVVELISAPSTEQDDDSDF